MSSLSPFIWAVLISLAVALDLWLMRRARRYWLQHGIGSRRTNGEPAGYVFGVFSPVLTWLKYRRRPAFRWPIVYENQWSGWSATRDGRPSALGPGQWLTTAAPMGLHHYYAFRYRPWDVFLGLGLTLLGLLLAARLWVSRPAPAVEA